MNGYAAPVDVTFTTRADMQESVAGFTTGDVRQEFALALYSTPADDLDALRWLASLAVRLIDEIERN